MDNQYTYYQPEQDPNQQYRRPKKKMPSWVKAACLGLVFGVVAAASFQTVNVVGDRIFGTKDQSQGTVKHTTTSGSTGTYHFFGKHGDVGRGGDFCQCHAIHCFHHEHEH